MSKSLRFCFKVDKSVGLAEDEKDNPGEAFVCLKAKNVKRYQVPSEDYKTMQEGFRKMAAASVQCDISLIIPITLNEYLDNTEED